MNQMFYISYFKSEFGMIQVKVDTEAVVSIQFVDTNESIQVPPNENQLTLKVIQQLKEYLEEKRKTFDIPISLKGTEFQRDVWNEVLSIPYGTTKSYKEICNGIGRENGSRAVGTAIGKNPILIVVPCHRVIASDGTLGGYVGGIQVKERLLKKEKDFCEKEIIIRKGANMSDQLDDKTFKEKYLAEEIEFEEIDKYSLVWGRSDETRTLCEYLGLNSDEEDSWISIGEEALKDMLDKQKK